MSNEKVLVLQKKIVPIVREAEDLEIEVQDDMKGAVEILSQLNNFNDQITTEKEKVTKPLNEALKAERNRWKPIETMYADAIEGLREKMSVFQTRMEKERKAKEIAIASRIKSGKGNLSLEKGVEKIDALEKVEKEVATDVGLVQFREKKVLKITDPSLISMEYYMINEEKLLKALIEGKVVAGAEIDVKQIPVNYR